MSLAVTIYSKGSAGEHFEISLEKTASDKGIIRIKSWNGDQNSETSDPRSDELVKLYEIKTHAVSEITCKGDVFGPDPTVTCRLLDGGVSAETLVQVVIEGTLFGKFDGTTDYPISAGEMSKLKKFLADAGFPPALQR